MKVAGDAGKDPIPKSFSGATGNEFVAIVIFFLLVVCLFCRYKGHARLFLVLILR